MVREGSQNLPLHRGEDRASDLEPRPVLVVGVVRPKLVARGRGALQDIVSVPCRKALDSGWLLESPGRMIQTVYKIDIRLQVFTLVAGR